MEKKISNSLLYTTKCKNYFHGFSKILFVDSRFLFNVQPFNTDLNPFIHIYPTNGGKGKKVIIDIRNNLIKVLKSSALMQFTTLFMEIQFFLHYI